MNKKLRKDMDSRKAIVIIEQDQGILSKRENERLSHLLRSLSFRDWCTIKNRDGLKIEIELNYDYLLLYLGHPPFPTGGRLIGPFESRFSDSLKLYTIDKTTLSFNDFWKDKLEEKARSLRDGIIFISGVAVSSLFMYYLGSSIPDF